MKNFILTLITALSFCHQIMNAQWVAKAPIAGPRDGAASWVINGKFYVMGGGGYATLTEYDPLSNQWTAKAPISQGAVNFAMSFVINGKGYLCGGVDNSFNPLGSLSEYDPATNQWTTKAPLPSSVKLSGCFGFSSGGKGYVGCGDNNVSVFQAVYEYDPVADSWAQKNPFGGGARDFPYSFTINDTGYVGGGQTATGEGNDLWQYDQASDSWIIKAPMPSTGRESAVSFGSSKNGYVGLGQVGFTSVRSDVYQYDPRNDSWDTLAAFNPGGRAWPVGFATDTTIFICAGFNFTTYYNGLYKLTTAAAPTNTVVATGIKNRSAAEGLISCYPNPNNGALTVLLPAISDNTYMEIYNLQGELLKKEKALELKNQVQLNIPAGVYLLKITQQSRILGTTRIIRQ